MFFLGSDDLGAGNNELISTNCVACCPEEHEECQWSRETGCKVYTVDWGTLSTKPEILTCYGDPRIKLYGLTCREHGITYYSSVRVNMSTTVKFI